MKLKNDKGVTLLVLTITIIVLFIVTGITISNSQSQLGIKKVNNLYNDIESIDTKISDYYLKNDSLPILEFAYLNSSNELALFCMANEEDKENINPNDDGSYYVIDLSKLENLTLNYGQDYKKWDSTSSFQKMQDLYIINEVSHQIYYPKGVTYNGEKYFTKNNNAKAIDPVIATTPIPDSEFVIKTIDSSKILIQDSANVIISSKIAFDISSNYRADTLKYYFSVSENEDNINYSSFELDSSNSVSLSSKQLKDVDKYYLYLRALDVNGTEHIIKQEIQIN